MFSPLEAERLADFFGSISCPAEVTFLMYDSTGRNKNSLDLTSGTGSRAPQLVFRTRLSCLVRRRRGEPPHLVRRTIQIPWRKSLHFRARQGNFKYLCAHAQTQMTKTISLSEEAYEVLRRHKLEAESFSDTVLRLTRQGGKLSEVIGLHPELRGKTGLARAVRENRRRLDSRLGAR